MRPMLLGAWLAFAAVCAVLTFTKVPNPPVPAYTYVDGQALPGSPMMRAPSSVDQALCWLRFKRPVTVTVRPGEDGWVAHLEIHEDGAEQTGAQTFVAYQPDPSGMAIWLLLGALVACLIDQKHRQARATGM
ncbi:MAG: hypothetical protein ACYCW6_24415 [Candidatus Xenobia bacterium]